MIYVKFHDDKTAFINYLAKKDDPEWLSWEASFDPVVRRTIIQAYRSREESAEVIISTVALTRWEKGFPLRPYQTCIFGFPFPSAGLENFMSHAECYEYVLRNHTSLIETVTSRLNGKGWVVLRVSTKEGENA